MIESKERVIVKTQKLIESLITPISLSHQKKLSPYEYRDVMDLVGNFIKISDKEIASLHDSIILSDEADYDFFKSKPSIGYYDQESAGCREFNYRSDNRNYHALRMEDIDIRYVARYIGNLAYKYKNINMEKEREYTTPTYNYINDDGEIETESELLVTNYSNDFNLSDSERENIKKNLRIIIRELHNESCLIGAHLLSFIIAIARQGKGTRYVNLNKHLLTTGDTFVMNKDGTIGSPISEAAGKVSQKRSTSPYLRAMNALYGTSSKDDISPKVRDLLWYCVQLDIDISKEDPKDFQVEQINNIITVHLKKNSDYIRRSESFFSKETFNELYFGNTLDDVYVYSSRNTIEDLVSSRVNNIISILAREDISIKYNNNLIAFIRVIFSTLGRYDFEYDMLGYSKVETFDDHLLRDSLHDISILEMKYPEYLPKDRESDHIIFHENGMAYLLGDFKIYKIEISILLDMASAIIQNFQKEVISETYSNCWRELC